jgi:hypothetical protein
MTTDLTGDFGVDEDEFDWDVFLPDPDEAAIEAEAASLEDETELNLDDSHFDWEGALREDAESENGAENGARAGAAYDRIVDTVRRSFEEPEPEADTKPAPVASQDSETHIAAQPEPETADLAAAPLHRDDEPAREIELNYEARWEDEPGWVPSARFVDEPDLESGVNADIDIPREPEQWLDLELESVLGEPDPEPDVTFEPENEAEPVVPRFAEAVATVGAVGAMEPAAAPPPEPDPTWAMAPSEPWEVDGAPTSASTSDPLPARNRRHRVENDGEAKQRSRVFKATVVLACLFLVVVAAAVVVRALHHPTTAVPPAHVTSPAPSASSAATSAAASAGTARLQTASDAVDSATTAASVGITSLAAFPTPTNVETVINPYISSLQLYETFLTGTTVPASAQPAAASAESQVRQDLQFLDTIDGLPPQQLGAFLVQFDTDATHLQTTLSTLEQNLRSSAS